MTAVRRYRCCVCGAELPAWLSAAQRPDGAMLLQHLSRWHPGALKPYLARMAAGAPIAETAGRWSSIKPRSRPMRW